MAAVQPSLISRILRFTGVGGLAFLVDIGVMQGLILLGTGPLLARAISIPVAMLFAWQMNRNFTFEKTGRRKRDEGARYALVAVSASLVNYALFAAIISFIAPPLPMLVPYWNLAAAFIAGAMSMWVSFLGFQLFAFSKQPPPA